MTAGKNGNQSGFTLIELLLTIAVLVIMVTIAIPNFRSLTESNRRAADYNEILAGFYYARSEAVKRRINVEATVTNPGGRWLLEIKDGSDVLRQFSASDSRVSVDAGSVTFNGLGRRDSCADTWSSDCTLGITYGKELKIQVLPSGQISSPDV